MKNHKFYWLLREPRDWRGRPLWSVEKLAEKAGTGRAHLNEVLNNVPGHGHRTRVKLVAVLRKNFTYWRDMLQALGWDENGQLQIADGTAVRADSKPVFHVESSKAA